MTFDDIPGLQNLKQRLQQSFTSGHVAHAQVFIGAEGGAALPMALAYAIYINCADPETGELKTDTRLYRQMSKFAHPDFHFLLPTATNKQFSKRDQAITEAFLPDWRKALLQQPYLTGGEWLDAIQSTGKFATIIREDSRKLVQEVAQSPFEAKFKIMLIWQPELMNESAANTILKILEEPPRRTVFLLVSHQPEQLLTTVISRTQRVQVPDFTAEELTQLLVKQGVEAKRATEAAWLADGNVFQAYQLAGDLEDNQQAYFRDWMRDCYRQQYDALMQRADTYNKWTREAQKALLRFGLSVMRECLLLHFAADLARHSAERKEFLANFSKVVNSNNLEQLVQLFERASQQVEQSANARMLFVSLSIKLAHALRS